MQSLHISRTALLSVPRTFGVSRSLLQPWSLAACRALATTKASTVDIKNVKKTAVETTKMICADVDANNNKYWHAYVLPNGDYVTEWGRVGVTQQFKHSSLGSVQLAQAKMAKDARSKAKNNYTVQRTLADDGDGKNTVTTTPGGDLKTRVVKEIGDGSPEIADLLGYLTDVNVHAVTAMTSISFNAATGQFRTPLGLVDQSAINDARDLLTKMTQYVQDKTYTDVAFKAHFNAYVRLIPQKTGMKLKADRLFPDIPSIRTQNDMLDSLEAALLPSKPTTPAAPLFKAKLKMNNELGTRQTVINLYNSTAKGRQYNVKRIYDVSIDHTRSDYEKRGKLMTNQMLLWHGTKASNLLSILKNGLMIPRSGAPHVTGRMFGDGLYFSDQSTKSINYATDFWQSYGFVSRTFMLLVDVALGNAFYPQQYGHKAAPSGHDSLFVKGGTCGVMNNEMIVYNTNQANPVLLVEFEVNKTN